MESKGIDGYVAAASELIPRYDAVSQSDLFSPIKRLIPNKTCRILDVGAGTGAGAAWFATHGHQVLAVEPVDAFRKAGIARHGIRNIEWLDDMLPALTATSERHEVFDLVLLSAVWHHLTAVQRKYAMPNLVRLIAPSGHLFVSVRNGPGARNRPCYDAPPQELVDLAITESLQPVLCQPAESVQSENRAAGVTWTWLVFTKGAPLRA